MEIFLSLRMKYLFLIGLSALLMIYSCRTTPDDVEAAGIQAGQVNSSGCLTSVRITENDEYIRFKTNGHKLISIGHFNTLFNCASGTLSAKAELVPPFIINLYEAEERSDANCICPYNPEYSISDIENGEYAVTLFKNGSEYFTFNLIIENSMDVIIAIPRYPLNSQR